MPAELYKNPIAPRLAKEGIFFTNNSLSGNITTILKSLKNNPKLQEFLWRLRYYSISLSVVV